MNSETSKKKTLVISLIYIFAAFFLYKIFSIVSTNLDWNYFVLGVLKKLVFMVLALLVACRLHKLDVLRWKTSGWKTGLKVGIYFIAMSIFSLVRGLATTFTTTGYQLAGFELILFIIEMLLIGVSEELLFRGLLQNCLHDFFGEDSVGSVKKAIVLTGLLFGLIHIFNIFTGSALSGTLVQVAQVFPLGLLFATVYYRSRKNLWVCIVIHAIYDACGAIATGTLTGNTMENAIGSYSAMGFVLAVIVFLIFLFVSRKKKIQECLDAK